MITPDDVSGLQATLATLRERLLAARGPQGYWEGRLSSSALSTATAVFALAVVDRDRYISLIDCGLRWLCANQNADGGWGDTVESPSNLSTTMLCYSALAVSDHRFQPPMASEGPIRSVPVRASRSMGVPPMSNTGVSPARSMGVPPMNPRDRHGQDARGTHGRGGRATHGQDAHATTTPDGVTTNALDAAICDRPQQTHAVRQAEAWLLRKVGSLEPQALARAVEQQYGKDRTFSVPILTMCALAGRLGTSNSAWHLVRPLPFELAVLPQRLYKWLRLPVVSYALPALIAVGQVGYAHRRPRNPLTRSVRHLSRARSLAVLRKLQPKNGGFLEAAPLTSFVVMSLAAGGYRDHEAVAKGVEFLAASIRYDGSWPIDTNLATWVTTLSINALAGWPGATISSPPRETVGTAHPTDLPSSARGQLREWLLSCQHREVHPYTRAAPGGWAWSNLPGAVPDGDDTAGALLALRELSSGGTDPAILRAASAGIGWLLGLQNRDGGIPTFCRGWTKLPFDKSTPDITAHAVGAMGAWLHELPGPLKSRTERAMQRALRYLHDAQRPDGSWVPLWFGNQYAFRQENPVYGTSRALTHLSNCGSRIADCGFDRQSFRTMCERAVQWLLSVQGAYGGWSGAHAVVSSIEETALAVDALATVLLQSAIEDPQSVHRSDSPRAAWLIRNTDHGRETPASPIGLYFARLWYFEELYPLVFSLSALSKAGRLPDRS